MQHGISFLPDSTGEEKSASDYFEEALALCDYADNNGIDSIKTTEYYLHPYGGYCPNPLSFLSAVASRTKNVRLMTGCLLPAFHHPIQIASETSAVDALSRGRLDVGFARAYLPYEFEAFGINIDESRQCYTETIDAELNCGQSLIRQLAALFSPFLMLGFTSMWFKPPPPRVVCCGDVEGKLCLGG